MLSFSYKIICIIIVIYLFMRFSLIKVLVFVFMFICSPLFGDHAVFILHSYHEAYPWTKSQRTGFRTVLNNAENLYPLYSTEYLDTKRRNFDENYEKSFVDYLSNKYKGYRPKLIYVTDDNALHFMLHNKEKLFPSVPVVFSGINDLSKKVTLAGSSYTGVFEKKEILPNLKLIKTLFPDEREVLVIGDGSTTALATQKEIENDTRGYRKMAIRFANGQDFDLLLNRLKGYKGKAVVLTSIGGFRTRGGQLIHLDHVIKQIVNAGSYVVLSLEDSYIQDGVLGGYAVDGNAQGAEAGKLALAILSYPGSPLPSTVKNTNNWIFDDRVLQRYKFALPDETGSRSTFLNLPKTFFQKHQELFVNLLYGLSITIVLVSLLLVLYMYRSRKIIVQREKTLLQVSESLNRAQTIAHIGNWEWDIKANTLWWSDEIYRIFGLPPQQFKATYEAFLERVYPEDQERVQEAVNHTLLNNTDYRVEHRIVKSDGMIRYVLEEGNTERDDLGNPLTMRGIVHDITEEKNAQRAVEESEEKYRNFVENAMVGIYRTDFSGHILYVNHTLAEMLGYDSPDELIGQDSTIRYSDPEERENFIRRLRKERSISNFEIELLDKHSACVPAMISATVEGDTLSGILIDMRELKQSREERDTLSKVVEQIDDAVVITDKMGIITYINQAFLSQTGYKKNEVIGENLKILKSGKQTKKYYQELWETILRGDVFRKTIINKKKNGDLYYENKTITPLKDDKNNIVSFVSTGKDVTQENILHEEIQRIASIDNLTGIYNRHKFEELFAIEEERSKRFSLPLSMIMIDIDHFKSINDACGHDTGDEVLKYLVDVIQSNIRKIDIFARWGGEEFLVLSPGIDLKNIQKLAEKLRSAVERAPFPVIGNVTVSLGISTLKENDTFSELFKRADQGLYHAKEHGRNRVGDSID